MNDRDRRDRAAHCLQAGVKMYMARRGVPDGSQHIEARIGVNIALRDHASLAMLLVAKGVITEEEYLKALADGMDEEVRMYEAMLTKELGAKITLVGRFGSVHDKQINDERVS